MSNKVGHKLFSDAVAILDHSKAKDTERITEISKAYVETRLARTEHSELLKLVKSMQPGSKEGAQPALIQTLKDPEVVKTLAVAIIAAMDAHYTSELDKQQNDADRPHADRRPRRTSDRAMEELLKLLRELKQPLQDLKEIRGQLNKLNDIRPPLYLLAWHWLRNWRDQ